MYKRLMAISIIIALLSITLPCNANLIDLAHGEGAGSFELGAFVNGGGIPGGAGIGYMGVAPGDSTTITGWTVGGPGDGVDWLVEPFANADTGIHSVDLQHAYNSSISTTIPTITENNYFLSFSAAVGINAPPYLPSAEGVVSAGSLVNETFTTVISDNYATQAYLQFTYLFTATDPITTIVFQGTGPTGPPSYYGPVIDSVSVTPVPLPASLLLLCSGLFGVAVITRTKPQKDSI